MGWFIAGGLLLVLAAMLLIDIRDHNFRPRFNRQAAREEREATRNDNVLRGLEVQQRAGLPDLPWS